MGEGIINGNIGNEQYWKYTKSILFELYKQLSTLIISLYEMWYLRLTPELPKHEFKLSTEMPEACVC